MGISAAAAPYAYPAIAAGAAGAASLVGGGGKSRSSPVEDDLVAVMRTALPALQGQIPGASNLATSSTQAYSGLTGGGGPFGMLSAVGPLSGLISTGSPTDISPVVQSTIAQSKQQIDDQAKAMQEQFASSGVRSGGDVIRGVGLMRERGAVDLGQILSQLAYSSQESARGRQLGAISTAGNLFGGARDSALSTIMSGAGVNVPSKLPSEFSQLLATLAPSAVYGAAQSGGKRNTSPGTNV